MQSVAFFIGLRYILSKRRQQFASFVSLFSLLGMALSVFALVVVLAIMNGFDAEIKQRILNVVPHAFIDQSPLLKDWQELKTSVEQQPQVLAATPYISGHVMLSSSSAVIGVELQAVLPSMEPKVSVVDRHMLSGQLHDLIPGEFGIVLGRLNADSLNVQRGDKVMMTLPNITVTPAGIFPRTKRFTVVGIFEVGAVMDQTLAMTHLTDAQRLFRYQGVNGLRLKLSDPYQSLAIAQQLQQRLPDYAFRDWSQTHASLFQAIKMEKRVVTLLMMMLILVSALIIIISLVLMVADKRNDIAVLRTLGMTKKQIMQIFVVQGSLLGTLGVLIGGVLGCLVAIYISDLLRFFEYFLGVTIFDPNVYFISEIPSQLRMPDIFIICGTGVLSSLLATLYPAYRAAGVHPAEALRYE